jgi:hypothetical protein
VAGLLLEILRRGARCGPLDALLSACDSTLLFVLPFGEDRGVQCGWRAGDRNMAEVAEYVTKPSAPPDSRDPVSCTRQFGLAQCTNSIYHRIRAARLGADRWGESGKPHLKVL